MPGTVRNTTKNSQYTYDVDVTGNAEIVNGKASIKEAAQIIISKYDSYNRKVDEFAFYANRDDKGDITNYSYMSKKDSAQGIQIKTPEQAIAALDYVVKNRNVKTYSITPFDINNKGQIIDTEQYTSKQKQSLIGTFVAQATLFYNDSRLPNVDKINLPQVAQLDPNQIKVDGLDLSKLAISYNKPATPSEGPSYSNENKGNGLGKIVKNIAEFFRDAAKAEDGDDAYPKVSSTKTNYR